MVSGSVNRRCGRAGSSHRAPNRSGKRLVGRGDTAKACESQFGDRHTVGAMRSAGIITTLERRMGVVRFEV